MLVDFKAWGLKLFQEIGKICLIHKGDKEAPGIVNTYVESQLKLAYKLGLEQGRKETDQVTEIPVEIINNVTKH